MQTIAQPYVIDRKHFEPAHLRLYESGELKCRVERALEKLADCRLCPRDCGANRLENKFAVCKTGRYAGHRFGKRYRLQPMPRPRVEVRTYQIARCPVSVVESVEAALPWRV